MKDTFSRMAHFLIGLSQFDDERGAEDLDFRVRMRPRQWAALEHDGVGGNLQVPRSPAGIAPNNCNQFNQFPLE